MSEVKIGGIGISGSKWLIIIPLIGTIVGGAYGGFELWHRYQAMEAKINKYVAPDLRGIRSELKVTQTKLEEALDYSRDIKNGLRDDIVRLEKILDKVEDDVDKVETRNRTLIDDAEKRFETKRDDLLNQYVAQKDILIRQGEQNKEILQNKIDLLKADMEKKLQKALDNPLAN